MTHTLAVLRRWIAVLAALAAGIAVPGAVEEKPPPDAAKTPDARKASKEPEKGEPPKPPAAEERPVTTARGEVGDLLRKWFAEGTAAGNKGDFYDNRDREHSGLNMSPYPQLQKIAYTDQERKENRDWALFAGVRPCVVFGNSSTSSGAYQGGSNPRQAYTNPKGVEVLYRQYRGNNLYIYPEHRDHDPGHNGAGDGYGDLFPTNTPFLIVSQGSSGSDQPFMRAVPFALAAFRPDVKRKLVEAGLLMPTIQMIFRYTNKHLTDPEKEYLTGKAHPSVFEGQWVSDVRMVKMAHEIAMEEIPPIALLKVAEEDAPLDGRDFFEPGATERHADTPAAISRIFRAKHAVHRMVVSAEGSTDVNSRPLAWHWTVLRGDAGRIRINRKNESGSIAELLIPWHDRRPVAEKSPMESNRVDIGVFAHNGKNFSAPSFVTFFFPDHEARTYDDAGRILEIGYKMGETSLSVSDWPRFFALLKPDASSWPAKFLRAQFKEDEIAGILKAAEAYGPLTEQAAASQEKKKQADAARNKAAAELKTAEEKKKSAEESAKKTPGDETKAALDKAEADRAAAADALKKADEAGKAAQKALDAAQKAANDFLGQKREGMASSVQAVADRVLAGWAKAPDFCCANGAAIEEFLATPDGRGRKGPFASARARVVALGIMAAEEGRAPGLRLMRGGDAPAAERATAFEKAMLERLNGEIVASVLYPGVVRSEFRVNYVPPEICEPPSWRDVYRYDPKGNEIGWTRYGDAAPADFNADGLKVIEKDARGRPVKAQTVKYEPEKLTEEQRKKRPWPYWRPTLQQPGSEIRWYDYEGDDDWKGKVAKTETVEEKKPEKSDEKKDGRKEDREEGKGNDAKGRPE